MFRFFWSTGSSDHSFKSNHCVAVHFTYKHTEITKWYKSVIITILEIKTRLKFLSIIKKPNSKNTDRHKKNALLLKIYSIMYINIIIHTYVQRTTTLNCIAQCRVQVHQCLASHLVQFSEARISTHVHTLQQLCLYYWGWSHRHAKQRIISTHQPENKQ